MSVVAIMATFPARAEALPSAIETIAGQVSLLTVVLNEYGAGDAPDAPANVEFVFPPEDLKDTGKFYPAVNADDFVFLCDDDILYPEDYVDTMVRTWRTFEALDPIVGVHGIIYSDIFDGDPLARLVHVFNHRLDHNSFVNQLGTGTVVCRGYQMPSFDSMRGSERFVDVRFARRCEAKGYPRICIQREAQWLADQQAGNSIFDQFTTVWPLSVVREAQHIAGFRFLPDRNQLAVASSR